MAETKALQGIDVSEWQGSSIDWSTVAKHVDFAILRAGYGRYVNQEDKAFAVNYDGCKSNDIKIGIYWYAYATSPSAAKAEAETCLKIMKNRDIELPIYYDIEESSTLSLGKDKVDAIFKAFAEVIEAAGYDCGIYSMANALNNNFSQELLKDYPVWVAHVDVKQPNVKCAYTMWQYTWKMTCPGISGQVDADYWYVAVEEEQPEPEVPTPEPEKPAAPKLTNEQIATEVIQGKWGNGADRVARLTAAGYDATAIQKIVDAQLSTSKPATSVPAATLISVARDVISGKYGNGVERVQKLSAKGYNATNVQKCVNALLSGQPIPNLPLMAKTIDELAQEVIQGKWGNGEARKQRITAAGYSYLLVQQKVNQLLDR